MHPYFFTVARLLLGAVFLVFGANGFFLFIEVPEFHPFMAMLVESRYIYVIKAIEVVAGLMLLSNRFVLLALLLLGPVLVNIGLYHLLLDPRNAVLTVVLAVLYGLLLAAHWAHFKPLLRARV